MIQTLGNRSILVTREAQDAEKFAKKISLHGGKPVITPLIQVHCLIEKFEEFNQIEWIFFTSVNGVRCFMHQYPNFSSCKIAAVGPKTASALEQYKIKVDFVPSIYNAEVMAAEFLQTYPNSELILFVRGTLSSNVLLKAFKEANKPYKCIDVYETSVNVLAKKHLNSILQEKNIDFITFTSPSTVNAFVLLAKSIPSDIPVICIGTTTERRANEVGFKKTITASNFTIEGMLEVLEDAIERSV